MSQIENGRGRDVSKEQKSALLLLFVTFFIDILGFGLVLTLSPYYVQRYPFLFGLRVPPGLAVGALTACYPLLQLICSPFWGRLSDRVGRRPIILLSLFGNGLAWVLFGVARSLAVLFLARILAGILSSASLPTVQAYIADSTPPEKRSVWIGIVVGMGFSFGFMLGPPIGGLLGTSPWPSWMNAIAQFLPRGQEIIAANHLSYPAFLAAAIAFTNFLAAMGRLPESLSPELRARAATTHRGVHLQQFRQALLDPKMGSMLLILWLSTFAMQSLEQNITLYGNKYVSTSASVPSWQQLTPEFVKGHEVYQVGYAADAAPPVEQRSSLLQLAKVQQEADLPPGRIRMTRHLIEQDTGFVLFVVAFVVGMIQGGGLRKLVPRFGEIHLILAGSVIAAAGFFLVPTAAWLMPLVGAASIVAVGFSFISPCLRGLISQDTEAHAQGTVQGIAESVRGLAMAAGPLVGGWLFDWGSWLPFTLGGICMLLGGLFALRLRALHTRDPHSSEPDTSETAATLVQP